MGRHPKPFTRTEVPKYLKTCKSTFRMDNIRRTARADSMLCCELGFGLQRFRFWPSGG